MKIESKAPRSGSIFEKVQRLKVDAETDEDRVFLAKLGDMLMRKGGPARLRAMIEASATTTARDAAKDGNDG